MRYSLIALLFLPSLVSAASLTVSPGQDIAAALHQMHSGDTLTLSAGTYDATNLHPPSGVTVQGSGAVTIRATGSAHVFDLTSSNVTLRGLSIEGGSVGVWVEGGPNTLQDVTVRGQSSQGIALFCRVANHPGCGYGGNTLTNVQASGAGAGGCHAGGRTETGWCHGVYIYSDGNTIVGGEFSNNNGYGIQSYGANTHISDIVARDNVAGSIVVSADGSQITNSILDKGSQAAVLIAYGSATLRDLTLPSGGVRLGSNAGQVAQDNVGSGATLIPGQSIAAARPSTPPIPKNLRTRTLP